MPVTGPAYYGVLDSVRFRHTLDPDVRQGNLIAAAGVVMLDVLAAGLVPVLSENQAFDSALLLGQLATADADASALLSLIRAGRLRVRLNPTAAVPRQRGDGPPTLLDAFTAKLGTRYEFSAWPELTDPAVQDDLRADLARPWRLGIASLSQRVAALAELSAAAAEHPAAIGVPIPGRTLDDQVHGSLALLTDVDPATVARVIEAVAAEPVDKRDKRSTWYRHLKPEGEPTIEAVREVVDLEYNLIVAASFGIDGTYQESPVQEAALAVAGTEPGSTTAERLVAMVTPGRDDQWLTWSRVQEMLPEADAYATSERRGERVTALYSERVVEGGQSRSSGFAIMVGMPASVFATLGAAGSAAVGPITGPVVVGVVSLVVAPLLPRIRERIKRADAARRSAVLATGAGAWWSRLVARRGSQVTPPIRRVRERLVYGNRFIYVYDDDVLFAGDRPGRYVRVVESGGRPGVAVLARCGGDVALVRVYRYALDAWEWGVPRGFAQGGDPAATARAELHEELGAEPDTLLEIGTMSPNSGLLSGLVHLYAADYAAPVAAPVDTDEVDEVRWLPWSALLGEIAAGRVNDSFTLAAVAVVTARALAPDAAAG